MPNPRIALAAVAFVVCAAGTASSAPPVSGPVLHLRESLAQRFTRSGTRKAPVYSIRDTRRLAASFGLPVSPVVTAALNGASRVAFRVGALQFDARLLDDPSWTPIRRHARFKFGSAGRRGSVNVAWTSRRVTVTVRGAVAAVLDGVAAPPGKSRLVLPADATVSVGDESRFFVGGATGRARVTPQTILGERHDLVNAQVTLVAVASDPSMDFISPTVHVDRPVSGSVVNGSPVIVEGTAADERGLAHVFWSLDGGAETEVVYDVDAPAGSEGGEHATFAFSLPLAGAGAKSLRVRAEDEGGNSSAHTVALTFIELRATAIATGADTSFVVRDSLVQAWGADGSGQLGDGPGGQRLTPALVSQFAGVTAVSSSNAHTVTLRPDGTVWCTGDNLSGELGDGTNASSTVPVRTLGLTDIRAVAAGWTHSMALGADGSVWCWGANGFGECGDGTAGGQRIQAVRVPGISTAVSVAAGYGTSLALLADGTVRAWGRGTYGVVPVFSQSNPTPVTVGAGAVGGPLSGVVEIAVGVVHATARKADGTVWAWGFVDYGGVGSAAMGQGSHFAHVPVRVPEVSGATAIATSSYTSAALLADGTVMTWGFGGWSALGDGSTAIRPQAQVVPNLFGVVRIASGSASRHFLGQRNDDSIVGWGSYTTGVPLDSATTGDVWHAVPEVIDLP